MLVDSDQEHARVLAKKMILAGFSVTTSNDAEHARSILESKRFSALILDVTTARSDSVDLIIWAHEMIKGTPLIAMIDAAAGSEHISRLASYAGLVVRKPVDSGQIIEFLRAGHPAPEREDSFSGKVDRIDLLEYLQFVMFSGQKAILEIYSEGGIRGTIFVDRGDVRHATFGDRAGEEALYACLCARGGVFYNRPWHEPQQVTIDKPGQFLLFEAARIRDESRSSPGKSNSADSAYDDIVSQDQQSGKRPFRRDVS